MAMNSLITPRRRLLRVEAFSRGGGGGGGAGSCAAAPGSFPPSSAASTHDDATYERILRYPSGVERRIRYPLPPLASSSPAACGVEDPAAADLTDGCWGDTCWHPREEWAGRWWAASKGGAGAGGGLAAAEPAEVGVAAQYSARVPNRPTSVMRRATAPDDDAHCCAGGAAPWRPAAAAA